MYVSGVVNNIIERAAAASRFKGKVRKKCGEFHSSRMAKRSSVRVRLARHLAPLELADLAMCATLARSPNRQAVFEAALLK